MYFSIAKPAGRFPDATETVSYPTRFLKPTPVLISSPTTPETSCLYSYPSARACNSTAFFPFNDGTETCTNSPISTEFFVNIV